MNTHKTEAQEKGSQEFESVYGQIRQYLKIAIAVVGVLYFLYWSYWQPPETSYRMMYMILTLVLSGWWLWSKIGGAGKFVTGTLVFVFIATVFDLGDSREATRNDGDKQPPTDQRVGVDVVENAATAFRKRVIEAQARLEYYDATEDLSSSSIWLKWLESGDEFKVSSDKTPRKISIPMSTTIVVAMVMGPEVNFENEKGERRSSSLERKKHSETSYVLFSSEEPSTIIWKKK